MTATAPPPFEFDLDTERSLAADQISGEERARQRKSRKPDTYAQQTDKSRLSPRDQQRQLVNGNVGEAVYFDIETVPDWDREPTFNLPPIPEPVPEKTLDECPNVENVLIQTVSDIGRLLRQLNPCNEWLDQLQSAEESAEKSRKGVADAVKAIRNEKEAQASAESDRIKLLSATPEYCRIVAIGMAVGNHDAESFVIDDSLQETDLLDAFWETVADHSPLIGFNVLHFDLPVILFRSALLGVPSSRMLNLSFYRNDDVVDLAVSRFGRQIPRGFGLKPLSQLCGIEVPAGETNGGDVNDLWEAGDTESLGNYVESDVDVTRNLHRLYSGYFCI